MPRSGRLSQKPMMFLNWTDMKEWRPEVKASELKAGRTFGVTFQDGDDFMTSLAVFCRENEIRQGYIPMFIAGFAEAHGSPSASSASYGWQNACLTRRHPDPPGPGRAAASGCWSPWGSPPPTDPRSVMWPRHLFCPPVQAWMSVASPLPPEAAGAIE